MTISLDGGSVVNDKIVTLAERTEAARTGGDEPESIERATLLRQRRSLLAYLARRAHMAARRPNWPNGTAWTSGARDIGAALERVAAPPAAGGSMFVDH